jgi:hypothetical protein
MFGYMEKDLHLYQFFAITYAVWYTACQFIALKIPDFQDIYTSEDTHTHTQIHVKPRVEI